MERFIFPLYLALMQGKLECCTWGLCPKFKK